MVEAALEAVKESQSTDLAVDGFWQKRGYTFLNGTGGVTNSHTSKVIFNNIEVMSKYCAWRDK